MPYIGTKHRSDNDLLVTAKVHGPTLRFMFDPKDVLKEIKRITESEEKPDPKRLAIVIVDRVADLVEHDPNAIWLECEVLGADGILYSDTVVLKE